VHECDRRQTTDHTTEKCVGIGEIAWAAKAIPLNNSSSIGLSSSDAAADNDDDDGNDYVCLTYAVVGFKSVRVPVFVRVADTSLSAEE